MTNPVRAASPDTVLLLEVRGVVDPFTAQYVERSLNTAHATEAQLVIIQLDTVGGLDRAMRDIVQAILDSDIPVIVFVEPSGAQAASAGAYITLAAHLAAMAPDTDIGQAHPSSLGYGQTLTPINEEMVNEAAAYISSIARQRDRNAQWAERAVRDDVSLTAQQALDSQVIDIVAEDLSDLLANLNGQRLPVKDRSIVLDLSETPIVDQPMTWLEWIVHSFVGLNITYALLCLGILALIAEVYHPGAIIPAVTGVICLVLAFIGLGSLPLNWMALALIGLAFIFFIVDLKMAGLALTVAGAVSFIIGSLFLFSPFTPGAPLIPRLSVSPWLLGIMTTFLVAFFSIALTAGLKAQRQAVLISNQTLLGETGTAVSDLHPQGVVQVRNETWSAIATAPVKAGEMIEVIGTDGLYLQVRRLN